MAKKSKTPDTRLSPSKKKSIKPNPQARATPPAGPAKPSTDTADTNDDLDAKLAGTEELASGIPVQREQATRVRPGGRTRLPRRVRCARTIRSSARARLPRGTARTRSAAAGPLSATTRPSVRSIACASTRTSQRLTTNQGVPVGDNQNSLKAGLRGPTLLEDFILREKITHFDHERIPERIVHARGSAAHGYFECYKPLDAVHPRVAVRRGRQADAGLRALLDRARRARLDRHGARRARLRGEVLHRRRQLGSGRQQHPGVLHPGRDEVSRSRARREARAAFRHAAGGHGARHVLGLRVADARDHRTC